MSLFNKIKFKLTSNPKKSGLAAAVVVMLGIATPMVGDFEGLRNKAYPDVGGIPTICYGETLNVKMGDYLPTEVCTEMLKNRLATFGIAVDGIITPPMSPETHAAFTSFAYNVGIGAFQKSTLVKKYNAGDFRGACNELPKWNKVKGKAITGLTTRRQKEKALCLKGI